LEPPIDPAGSRPFGTGTPLTAGESPPLARG